jgi:hypothetical protein
MVAETRALDRLARGAIGSLYPPLTLRGAKALSAWAGKRFEATLKHREALLKSGLIVAEKDPTDTRHA